MTLASSACISAEDADPFPDRNFFLSRARNEQLTVPERNTPHSDSRQGAGVNASGSRTATPPAASDKNAS